MKKKIVVAGDELHFQQTEKKGWIKVDINTNEMSTWLSPSEVEKLIDFLQKNKKGKDA
jgi:hypothetical protein